MTSLIPSNEELVNSLIILLPELKEEHIELFVDKLYLHLLLYAGTLLFTTQKEKDLLNTVIEESAQKPAQALLLQEVYSEKMKTLSTKEVTQFTKQLNEELIKKGHEFYKVMNNEV